MKKIWMGLILLHAASCFSQLRNKSGLPSAIIKFTPQHMLRGGLWLGGEIFNDSKKSSSQISLEMVYNKPVGKQTGFYETKGFTIEYMFRYYPSRLHVEKTLRHEKIYGFYTGIFAQAGKYEQKHRRNEYSGFSTYVEKLNTVSNVTYYPGFVVGRTMSLGESIYLDVYFGAGMHLSNYTVKTDDPKFELSNYYFMYNNGILPKIGFSIGIGL